jgi:outer membrane protein, multidrug efflux system
MAKLIVTLGISLLLVACTLEPNYHRPDVAFPNTYSAAAPLPELIKQINPRWWLAYNDPILTQLIERTLAYNHDLAAAVTLIDQAAAQALIARNALLPSFSFGSEASHTDSSQYSAFAGQTVDSFSIGANARWELDLWGKLRNSSKAAQANVLAAVYNKDALRLSLVAQVTKTYFQLLAADSSLTLSQETEQTRKKTLKIQEMNYKAGNISMLEVQQAKAELESASLSATQQKLAVKTTETALSILLGQDPRAFLQKFPRQKNLDSVSIPSEVAVNLPSELLLRRPDLAAAEQNLIAANADIGVARAAFFPSVIITGNIATQSLAVAKLFSGPAGMWSFAGDMAAPIFNFGTNQANVDFAKAKKRQLIETYQKSVQTSFKEVLDSLRTIDSMRQQSKHQGDQLQANKEALRISTLRYDNGYSGYLTVLDSQRNTYNIQLLSINTQLNYLNATVDLYKALGGGWQISTTARREAK